MFKKPALAVAMALGLTLAPLTGTASAEPVPVSAAVSASGVPRPDGMVDPAAAGLPCGWGYQCDDKDPGDYSWEKTETDDRVSAPGCATLELRSGRKDNAWYAWGRLTVASGCGRFQGWIDRSYDDGKTWQLLGFFETSDSNYGNMFYWPDNAKIRAGFKKPNEDWGKSRLTKWHG
ncbi:hypothetical protein ACIPW5_25250 [Streptomyces sp. NPDC090077]|uniref:hypothetical protein n=1 Tax=Streptomyces sp. NPDC090077 TaxID=3365938 RepID=UPI0037FA6037